jgi:hypothetical protein
MKTRTILRRLVRGLPICWDCTSPATGSEPDSNTHSKNTCDAHADKERTQDFSYAEALRAAKKRLAKPKKELSSR